MLAQGGYRFTDKKGICDQKSIYFAKFTDSASRALDYYLKNQDKFKQKPEIEFTNNVGRFHIPTGCENGFGTEKNMAHFRFDIDSNVSLQGQQGRFECVRHKNGSQKLVKFGSFVKRLRIHANEDVYEKTKNRMAAIELEQKRNCTVQIDLNHEPVNCKVKVDRNLKHSIISAAVDIGKASKVQLTKSTKPRARILPKTCNPSLMKRPLKERIIHMLAVRPYRKIELSAALRRDGLRETDKAHLMSTLISVATIKGNVYHLLRHVWNDVQEDWPFYSEDEKQKMKRNKPQNLTPPSSDSGISVSSNQSPSRTTAGDKSPSCQYKRPGYINGVDGFQVKRPRISHFTKQTKRLGGGNEENVQQISPSRITNCFDEIIAKSGLFNTAVKNPPLRPNSRQNTKSVANSFGAVRREMSTKVSCNDTELNGRNSNNLNIVPHSDVFDSAPPAKPLDKVVRESPAAQLGLDKFVENFDSCSVASSNTAMSMSPLPAMSDLPSCSMFSNDSSRLTNVPADYLKQYVTITDLNQRRKYKADFMKFFAEYQTIFEEITNVTEVFAQLGDRLRQHVRGSSEFKMIADEIVRRYQLCKEVKFCETKERFNYLHDMLSHIKRLVYEYDETFL